MLYFTVTVDCCCCFTDIESDVIWNENSAMEKRKTEEEKNDTKYHAATVATIEINKNKMKNIYWEGERMLMCVSTQWTIPERFGSFVKYEYKKKQQEKIV